MSVSPDTDVIDRTTRTLQIIVLALVSGLVSFLGVAVFLRLQTGPKPAAPAAVAGAGAPRDVTLPVLTVAAVTFTAILIPLSYVVPRLVAESSCKRLAAGTDRAPAPGGTVARLAAVYQTQKVLGAALNEFPAFLALIAYLLEGNVIALALAVLLIAGVAVRFPRREAVGRWIDDHLARAGRGMG